MKGTSRKEMRKLLNKCIALMKEAFDKGLNMEIDTRLKEETNRPWAVGHVWKEGDIEGRCDFTLYEWRSVEENEEQLTNIKQFIEK